MIGVNTLLYICISADFLKKIFQKHYKGDKQFGSRSGQTLVVSVAEKTGLSLALSETLKTGFLTTMPI